MSKTVIHNNEKVVFYDCKDCGMVYHQQNGLRPNNKFCSRACMAYVLENGLSKGNCSTIKIVQ